MLAIAHLGCILAALTTLQACRTDKAQPPSHKHDAARGLAISEPPATADLSPMAGSAPILLVFSRDYCTPCQVMKPWLEELATELSRVDIVTVNVDRQKLEAIGSYFQVSAVPSLVYIEADGRIAKRTEGLARKPEMLSTMRELGWRP